MFNIFIQGLKDGEHGIDMQVPVEDVPDMFEEYFGIINLKGSLRRIGNRFTLFAEADCDAKMICDISLEEFTETINVEVNLSFMLDEKRESGRNKEKQSEGIKISSDGKYADIADEIREVFAVSLPMKRVAPRYREKDFKEIFPEYDADTNDSDKGTIDDRWEPLRKIISN